MDMADVRILPATCQQLFSVTNLRVLIWVFFKASVP